MAEQRKSRPNAAAKRLGQRIAGKKARIGIIGLGYVGLPLAVALARHFPVLGFDIDKSRIEELGRGEDRTREIEPEILRSSNLKLSADPADLPGQQVTTGHCEGVITLNVNEADDEERVRRRVALHEPYRTLRGHLRHESGHYYWDRLVRDGGRVDAFRAMFGDETLDYQQALATHYAGGAPASWQGTHVSAYATAHPWEDWAETWAHYLHMIDTIDTALSFGIDADNIDIEAQPWGRDALWRPDDATADVCLGFVNGWVEVTAALNEMSRSMGLNDFYPFVMSRPVITKLHFIHLLVQGRPAVV